jgi:hypothetical protein
VKRNSGQKSTLIERDSRSPYSEKIVFEKSQNYCGTGDRTAELRSLFPQKQSDVSFTNPTSKVGAAIAKPLVTESNAQMLK